ncbi:site-2 protease family protein [Streptomyces scopuliridis]|uniref:Site-2 protease family protein n=1 Tax=Streptomyces scopuliridis TaxID=452529 RepID=A0ACD4ZDB5_9ACTN|nr:site-2 protease family protein [Streptomyces scopuliridis]WSB31881.1 site-2 protease family protein [Streptomyces scopuliridis]WSB96139.1 site-2 protease family protein [Streptomyces scopuliridis]WSC10155.1 site-2 protease family protein [Streptomyces scopuliridis]
MRATFTLGRIAGVRIGVHWSVLVIFVLIAFSLAQGRFPQTYPGHTPLLYWGAALATAVVFFASLLAHELAHAIVARRNGVQVDDIVLWLLGGVARLRSEASTPAAELRVAGVGPLVSLLLGVFFGLCAWLLRLGSAPGLLVEATAWLAGINVLLAVFNAIPAAPLDGGRLLRAVLWWRSGDRYRATAGATAAGRAFGWFLVVAGFLLFVTSRALGALWLALIGWFLIGAATTEGRQAQLKNLLAGVPVRQAMTPDPVVVPRSLSVSEFLGDPRYRYRHSAFPVVGPDGNALGLLTLERARHSAAADPGARVTDAMRPLPEVLTAAPGDSLVDLLPRMRPGAEFRVLVLDGDRLLGIVSPSDVSRTVSWLSSSRPAGWGGRRE